MEWNWKTAIVLTALVAGTVTLVVLGKGSDAMYLAVIAPIVTAVMRPLLVKKETEVPLSEESKALLASGIADAKAGRVGPLK